MIVKKLYKGLAATDLLSLLQSSIRLEKAELLK